MKKTLNILFAIVCAIAMAAGVQAQETLDARIGRLEFTHSFQNGYPTVETIWIPTEKGRAWFSYFRLYSPKKAFLDRTWVLPDIENVK